MTLPRGHRGRTFVALIALSTCGALGVVGTPLVAEGARAATRPMHVSAAPSTRPPTTTMLKKVPALRVVPKPARDSKTASIGSAGGRIRVTTPSHVSATLDIPAGALASETTITVTPLKAVKRVPFAKGIAGAVRLSPEGLVLVKPARLVLHPRHAVRRQVQTAFAATGDGHSFHIYPSRSGRRMTLSIRHFSVYGEGAATRAEQRREGKRAQTSPGAAVERDMAVSASDRRLAADLEELAQQASDEIDAAMSDDSRAGHAVDLTLTLAEELELVGWSSDVLALGDQLPGSVGGHLRQLLEHIRSLFPDELLNHALAASLARCRVEQTQASRDDVLSVLELQRLLGSTNAIDLSILDQCFGYELVYTHVSSGSVHYTYDHSDTTYTDTGDYSESRDVRFSASAPLAIEPGATTFGGTAALPYASSTWSSLEHKHSNRPLAYPDFCDSTITDTLTAHAAGTLVATDFVLGPGVRGKVSLVGLSDTWHHDWEVSSGPCGSVVQDGVENHALESVAVEHTSAGDGVKYTYDSTTGDLVAVSLTMASGWTAGTAQPLSTGVVATKSVSGVERDLNGQPGIPFTDTFQIVKTTR